MERQGASDVRFVVVFMAARPWVAAEVAFVAFAAARDRGREVMRHDQAIPAALIAAMHVVRRPGGGRAAGAAAIHGASVPRNARAARRSGSVRGPPESGQRSELTQAGARDHPATRGCSSDGG